MSVASIDLGSTKFSRKGSRLGLTMSSTCSIGVPAHISPITSAKGLHQLTKSGELWVARAGMCRLGIFTSMTRGRDGEILASVDSDGLAEAISSCKAWSQLGLHLSRDTRTELSGSPFANEPQCWFSIDHPASASGLVAPSQIPCAHFRGVECHFRFEFSEDRRQNPATKTRSTAVATARRSKRLMDKVAKRCLPRPDRTFKTSPSVAEIFGDPATRLEATSLTLAALRDLIGVGKRVDGIRASPSSKSPTLLEMVPAVLNFHYLNTIAARSSFLPTITSVLGNLSSAQSPTLRQRVADLSREASEIEYRVELSEVASPWFEEHSGDRDSAHKNIERRLCRLLLVNTSVLEGTDSRSRNRSMPSEISVEEMTRLSSSYTEGIARSVGMTRPYLPIAVPQDGLQGRQGTQEEYHDEDEATQDPHQCNEDEAWREDEQDLCDGFEASRPLNYDWDEFPGDLTPHVDLPASQIFRADSRHLYKEEVQQEAWFENDLGDHAELDVMTDAQRLEYSSCLEKESLLYGDEDGGYYVAAHEQVMPGDWEQRLRTPNDSHDRRLDT